MQPTEFKMSTLIPAPPQIPQCPAVYATHGIDSTDEQPLPFILQAWKPSKADIEAMNRGDILWVKIFTRQLQPMVLFTTDKDGKQNK